MDETRNIAPRTHGTLLSYSVGFALSIILTLAAYVSVVNKSQNARTVVIIIVGLAIAQLLTQLLFFLHLGREAKPRLRLVVFLFMTLVLGILVIGSLWIMNNLDYSMMPHEVNEYLQKQQGGF